MEDKVWLNSFEHIQCENALRIHIPPHIRSVIYGDFRPKAAVVDCVTVKTIINSIRFQKKYSVSDFWGPTWDEETYNLHDTDLIRSLEGFFSYFLLPVGTHFLFLCLSSLCLLLASSFLTWSSSSLPASFCFLLCFSFQSLMVCLSVQLWWCVLLVCGCHFPKCVCLVIIILSCEWLVVSLVVACWWFDVL